jgi:hypothetical protein
MGKPLFKRAAVEGKGQQLICPMCGAGTLTVYYRDLLRPKKGKRQKGIFGVCGCGFENRISSGQTQ